VRHSARTALIVWVGLSLLVAASLWVIQLRLGTGGFAVFIQQPPLINLPVTLASVAMVWIAAGAFLHLLQAGHVTSRNLLALVGFFLVLFACLNVLSERWRYGDYTYYYESAATMYRNEPLHGSYFYPPLWATLTQFLVPAGEETFFIVLWLLDLVSFAAFYFLLYRVLERYGFGPRFAAIVTTTFMLANAPLLRTLVYVQVNLHTLNLILLAILFYPKRQFLSALMLALAVHMKGSPAVLVVPFLLARDWRWLGWFGAGAVAVAGLTVLTDGFAPFLDVLQHWQGLAASDNTIYHDTSFDSFFRSSAQFIPLNLVWTRILIYSTKALLLVAAIMVMLRSARQAQFIRVREQGAWVLNSMPPLFVLFTLAAPVVWEHHGVFLALSFLLMLKRLETPHEWLWFGFAYLLEFLLPTFDFYPWSFGRLIAPLLILWQMWWLADRKGDAPVFTRLNRWFDRLPILRGV
jgi:hypothetical protein